MKGSKEMFLDMQMQGVDIDCNGNMYQEFQASNIPVGAENEPNVPWNEEEFKCTECGRAVKTEFSTCSTLCHKTSML